MCENDIVFLFLRIQSVQSVKPNEKCLNEENYSARDDEAIPRYN